MPTDDLLRRYQTLPSGGHLIVLHANQAPAFWGLRAVAFLSRVTSDSRHIPVAFQDGQTTIITKSPLIPSSAPRPDNSLGRREF